MRSFPLPGDADLIVEKQNQAIAAMKDLDIDAWLIFLREGGDSHIVQTIAGPEVVVQNAALVISRDGRRIAVLEPIDIQNGTGTHFTEIEPYQRDIGPALRKVWKSIGPKRVAVNFSRTQFAADGLTHGMYLRLVDALGSDFEAAAISSEELVMAVRAVKSATELDRIRKACDLTVQVADGITAILKPGVTDIEIGEFIARRGQELGADHSEASIAVNGVGKNEKGPKGKTVAAGQVVLCDMDVCRQGYNADIKRMWYISDKNHPFPDILGRQYDACRKAADYALTQLKPGEWGYDVHERCWAKLEELGFPRDKHAFGHQVGRQIHDAGIWLGDKDNPYRPAIGKLKANMVFTLDPTINRVGISSSEQFSVGVEDCAVVTPEGGVRLHSPQEKITIVEW